MAAIPAICYLPMSGSRSLFHRGLPTSRPACLCASNSLSTSSFPCPPMLSKVSAFPGNCCQDFPVGNGSGRRGRVTRMNRMVAFASPSAKYIRENYLVKKVSAKEVGEMVKGERNVPLVVDFYATWCGPCIIMAQQLETLAVEYEKNALFVKVDTDEEYEFARDMQVRGLPTLYFISPDPTKDAIRTEGLIPPEMIKNIIDNEL